MATENINMFPESWDPSHGLTMILYLLNLICIGLFVGCVYHDGVDILKELNTRASIHAKLNIA